MKESGVKRFFREYRLAKEYYEYIQHGPKKRKLTLLGYIWTLFTIWVREVTCRHRWTEEVRLNGPGPGPAYCTKCGKIL